MAFGDRIESCVRRKKARCAHEARALYTLDACEAAHHLTRANRFGRKARCLIDVQHRYLRDHRAARVRERCSKLRIAVFRVGIDDIVNLELRPRRVDRAS